MRACSRAKSVGVKGLRRGRCSSGGGAAASQHASHSAGMCSLLYCVPYQGSRSVATSCGTGRREGFGPFQQHVVMQVVPNSSTASLTILTLT